MRLLHMSSIHILTCMLLTLHTNPLESFQFRSFTSTISTPSRYDTIPKYYHPKQNSYHPNTKTKHTKTSLSISNIIQPIVLQKNNELSYTLFSMLLLSSVGITIETKYKIGKALSAPLVTMALGLLCSNVGLIPFSSTIYTVINKYLVALAIPLLLFDSDIHKVVKNTGSLLVAFFVGTIATVIGTIIASYVLPLRSNIDGWKIACALASRHIGGAINFIAVSETLGISGENISAAIAADNVVVALYFTLLFALSKPGSKSSSTTKNVEESSDDGDFLSSEEAVLSNDSTNTKSTITLSSISKSLAISSGLVVVSSIATQLLFPTQKVSSLPILSVVTVSSATIFPKFFSSLCTTGTSIGILFMQMFFAASGASSSIQLVLKNAPSLFLYSFVQIMSHFIILVSAGKYIFRLKVKELFLASNANVGGPTTAAAMAKAKDWDLLILPALLIGILGYSIGTPIGLALGPLLKHLPSLF